MTAHDASLQNRLQELEDHHAITELLHRHGAGIASHDHELLGLCFADDAVVTRSDGSTRRGKVEIARALAEAAQSSHGFDDVPRSTPLMSNEQIDVDGDTARCESFCFAMHAGSRAGETRVVVSPTKNVDGLVRTAEGWRIATRVLPRIWQFEVAGTVLPAG